MHPRRVHPALAIFLRNRRVACRAIHCSMHNEHDEQIAEFARAGAAKP